LKTLPVVVILPVGSEEERFSMRIPVKHLRRVYDVALKSAIEAGGILRKRFLTGKITVQSNLPHDVKLDVDVEVENLIIRIIERRFPDHGFICEEGGSRREESERKWIIDPLDGSVNFFKGIPHFCTSIAYRENETGMTGVVFDPVRNELFSAVHGSGAFFNGRAISRKSVSSLDEAVIAGGFFKSRSLTSGGRVFEKIAPHVKKVRFFGSAALDLCYLACGRVDGYIQHHVNDWDIAAASLIAKTAGVRVEVEEAEGKLNVLAAGEEIFEELRSHLET